MLSKLQACDECARQTHVHGELLLSQTMPGSESLELFTKTLSSAHGTSREGEFLRRLVVETISRSLQCPMHSVHHRCAVVVLHHSHFRRGTEGGQGRFPF